MISIFPNVFPPVSLVLFSVIFLWGRDPTSSVQHPKNPDESRQIPTTAPQYQESGGRIWVGGVQPTRPSAAPPPVDPGPPSVLQGAFVMCNERIDARQQQDMTGGVPTLPSRSCFPPCSYLPPPEVKESLGRFWHHRSLLLLFQSATHLHSTPEFSCARLQSVVPRCAIDG